MDIKPRSSMSNEDNQNNKPSQTNQPPPSSSDAAGGSTSSPQTSSPASPQPQTNPAADTANQPAAPAPAAEIKPFTMDDPSTAQNGEVAQSTPPEPAAASSDPAKPFDVEKAQSTPGAKPPTTPAPSPSQQNNTNPKPAEEAVAPATAQPLDAAQTTNNQTDNPTPASAGPSQPSATPAPAFGSTSPPSANQASTKKPKQKHTALIVGLVTAAIVLVAGYVFGYYLPNRPENVYRNGLERSGDAIHNLIIEATEVEQLEALNRMQMTGSMSFSSGDIEFEGSLNSLLGEQNTDSSFDVALTSAGAEDIGLSGDVRTTLADDERFPDIYFQLTGMASLGLNAYLPGIESYDGQWISVSSELLESSLGEMYDTAESDTQATPELQEYTTLVRDISATTNDYIFSANDETAVIQMEEFLGQEELGDISTNRYRASINQDNAIAYCQEIVAVFYRSQLNRTLSGDDDETIEANITEYQDQCQELPEEADGAGEIDETFDVWIDRDTKLIHKVRVSDSENDENYAEVGQRYSGGDELELFIYTQDAESDIKTTVTFKTNLQTNVSSVSANLTQQGDSPYSFDANLQVEPYTDEISVEAPAGAVSIEQVMEELFGAMNTQLQPGIAPESTIEFNDSVDSERLETIAPQETSSPFTELQRLFQ